MGVVLSVSPNVHHHPLFFSTCSLPLNWFLLLPKSFVSMHGLQGINLLVKIGALTRCLNSKLGDKEKERKGKEMKGRDREENTSLFV